MSKHFNKETTVFLVCILFVILLISCEEYLPDSYQSETYCISEMDDASCHYLTRSLMDTTFVITIDTSVTDTTIYDTSFTTSPAHILLFSSLLADLVDSTARDSDAATINSILDSLHTMMDTLVTDTTLYITHPGEADTSYAYYYHDASNGDLYFYISWDFTESNNNAFIDIDLIQRDAKIVANKVTVPVESISGCSEHVTFESGQEKLIPKIKTRCGFELEEAPYLVRFIVSEPAEVESFRTAILHE